ncbi:MAG: hypothetical protein KDD33_07835, partial [Bdellovibrionales bacterium]|nr:hypothetical protein [Bdellovibrionales bacterium]
MRVWGFFSVLLAFSIVINLWRLPHLVLENGGGAFLLLLFIMLHLVGLPLILAEVSLARVLRGSSLRRLYALKRAEGVSRFQFQSARVFIFLQTLLLFLLLTFLIHISTESLVYAYHYLAMASDWFHPSPHEAFQPHFYHRLLAILVSLVFIYGMARLQSPFWQRQFTEKLLPFVFALLLLIFLKRLFYVTNMEAIKGLFYPDFNSLRASAFLEALGHSLLLLVITLGIYRFSVFNRKIVDPVQLSVQVVLQVMACSLLTGTMAIPMLSEVNESPFGMSWIFEVLPRWLSYGDFGNYYCLLFFSSFFVMLIYLSVILLRTFQKLSKDFHRLQVASSLVSPLVLAFIVDLGFYLEMNKDNWQGWWGQGWLNSLEIVYIQFAMPAMALVFIWFLFSFTNEKERQLVFTRQQIFYHSRVFFKSWQVILKFVIPPLI